MTAKFINLLTRHCSLRTPMTVALLLAGPLSSAHAASPLQVPRLSSDTQTATAGYYRLSWHTHGITRIELQEADNPGFAAATLSYRGRDDARVVSGKPNGTWYYRVRVIHDQQSGPWSDTVQVSVAHHPLSRAFMFFGLGVIVFAATVWLVLGGAKDERNGRG